MSLEKHAWIALHSGDKSIVDVGLVQILASEGEEAVGVHDLGR